ncbi:MAG TPA: TolC family protein [Lacunisphaera sp.]|nr:TolC family protein [Lacunisphaera sp.]
MNKLFPFFPLAFAALLLAGCAGAPTPAASSARAGLRQVGAQLAGSAGRPELPVLHADSPPADFIRYAVLNQPAVAAAYQDWRAAVEAITPAGALPDPQFTFQADIRDTLMSFMPGLMFDLMGPGKRTAIAREAAAGAGVARRAYVTAVLRTAAEARRAWVELAYVEGIDRLYATTIHTAEEALELTNAEYATGRGMATFDRQIELENLVAEHHAHHAGIADRRIAARARFKSALGLTPDDPDPPWPHPDLVATPVADADELWRRAQLANPDLAQMRAMVEMTVAGVEVARQTGRPNFAVGAMVDLKADPLMFRPTANISLPLWRDKVAATVAAATARRDAAAARVGAEELNLAAELAQMLYMVREADRMLAYIDGTALPNFDRSYATLEAGVQSGMADAAMIARTRLMAIDLRHDRLEWLRRREAAAVDLALLVADVAPANSPLPAETP